MADRNDPNRHLPAHAATPHCTSSCDHDVAPQLELTTTDANRSR